ncbi:MAG: hypothetical protein LAO55_17540 [Acidobacteriia bacterium]|nr:hypothetical protein [Terriglobia bacterium]
MKSNTTPQFWRRFASLPREAQKLAAKNYQLWQQDPQHPSLRFRRLKGSDDLYTVRIGDRYRAIGQMEAGEITWTWIGSHADYNNLLL